MSSLLYLYGKGKLHHVETVQLNLRSEWKSFRRAQHSNALASFPGLPRFSSSVWVQYTEAEEREKRGRPGLIHHVSDVRWPRCGHDNDVRGRGLTTHSRKNRYEWFIIHETWPVQKVQSKNALSSSDCTTMILTTL